MNRIVTTISATVVLAASASAFAAQPQLPAKVVLRDSHPQARTYEHNVGRTGNRRIVLDHTTNVRQARVIDAGTVARENVYANAKRDRIVTMRVVNIVEPLNLDADYKRADGDPIDEDHHLIRAQMLGRYLNRKPARVIVNQRAAQTEEVSAELIVENKEEIKQRKKGKPIRSRILASK